MSMLSDSLHKQDCQKVHRRDVRFCQLMREMLEDEEARSKPYED